MLARRLRVAGLLGLGLFLTGDVPFARGQLGGFGYGPVPAPRRTRGTYGPRMSFGEFGYRMNYGYAFGNPYGGLGRYGYGFGYGFGPGYPPGGAQVYSSAYVTPGAGLYGGYYPPWAAYGGTIPNAAVFPYPAPNYPTRRAYVPAPR
jgi:hypothetical protein